MPDFHRLNKSRTVEMSKEELNRKLREQASKAPSPAERRKKVNPQSRKQQKITEQTKKQLPPQSPVRKKREEEARKAAERELRERRKKKGGSNVVYYLMTAILAVIIFSVLSVTVLFNCEKIVIEGESDYTEEQIIAASGLEGTENLVRLNTAGIPERILDKLVSLDSVQVDKVFPSTIKISVTRSVPMAEFYYNGKNYVISHIGRVMQIDDSKADCMQVLGYKPAESVVVGSFISAEDPEQDKLVADISKAIEKAEIDDITTVDISDSLALVMTYDDRVVIHLGSVLQIDEKMRIIKELVFNGYIAETEHVTLDVSDPSRAIQRPITTAPVTAAPVTEETDESEGEGEDTESSETTSGETTEG
ncbi:MAG: FtsQ-type POTRA domain-containing protein [Ruminiclostridium sp.]|nr:FtsQ-type POTRA domain-containing protein [Ruminiclostridium sp.]